MAIGKPQRFGWCQTGHHSECVENFVFEGSEVTCACGCHSVKSFT